MHWMDGDNHVIVLPKLKYGLPYFIVLTIERQYLESSMCSDKHSFKSDLKN